MALVISFVLEKKGLTEGSNLWSCFFFIIITEVCRHMGPCMKKISTGMGGDRMIEMVLLYLYRLMLC